MPKFTKKPIEIEARQLKANLHSQQALHEWIVLNGMGAMGWWDESYCIDIHTLEGTMRAHPGDWIIRGVEGEFYPCKPDIFEKTYQATPSSPETT